MKTPHLAEQHVCAAVNHIARLKGRMRIGFVPPDYYACCPKARMGGWGCSLLWWWT